MCNGVWEEIRKLQERQTLRKGQTENTRARASRAFVSWPRDRICAGALRGPSGEVHTNDRSNLIIVSSVLVHACLHLFEQHRIDRWNQSEIRPNALHLLLGDQRGSRHEVSLCRHRLHDSLQQKCQQKGLIERSRRERESKRLGESTSTSVSRSATYAASVSTNSVILLARFLLMLAFFSGEGASFATEEEDVASRSFEGDFEELFLFLVFLFGCANVSRGVAQTLPRKLPTDNDLGEVGASAFPPTDFARLWPDRDFSAMLAGGTNASSGPEAGGTDRSNRIVQSFTPHLTSPATRLYSMTFTDASSVD